MPPAQRTPILAAIPAETQEQVRALGTADFIAVEHTVFILDAMQAALGEEAMIEFWVDAVRDSYAGGLFAQLVLRAATLGGDGTRLLKLAPQAWGLSSRNCGEVKSLTLGNGEYRLYSDDFPPQVVASPGFASMFIGAIKAMLVVTRTKGEVVAEPAERGLAFRVRVLG
jgi:hypothetical protein